MQANEHLAWAVMSRLLFFRNMSNAYYREGQEPSKERKRMKNGKNNLCIQDDFKNGTYVAL